MLQEGLIPVNIATKLNLSEPLLSYHIRRAKSRGYVQNADRGIKRYVLTQAGKKFLEQYQKYKGDISIPLCRAENIRFITDILTKPRNLVDWHRVQMNNWTLYTSTIDCVRVKLNFGKQPTAEFLPSPTDGNGALELLVDLVQECCAAALRLEERTGLVIGPLHLVSRGEWVVYSPVARYFATTYGQVNILGLGKVNASKPRRIGEFEFQDVRDLADYMLMPRRLERMEAKLEKLETMITGNIQTRETKILNSCLPIRNVPVGE